MKKSIKLIFASLLVAVMVPSCVKEQEQITFSSDPEALTDVPCKDPSDQVLTLKTNANWIVETPTWVHADPIFGSGNSIVTFSVESTFINEKTDVAARSGEIIFSGGGKSYSVPISQLGYTAPYDPTASIGGIPDVEEFIKFVKSVNDNDGTTRWQNEAKEVVLLADIDLSEYDEWTPIGNPESVDNQNYKSTATGPAFKGVFDGGNHKITGFKPTVKVVDKGTFGLFGVLDGATVKDLEIVTDLKISAAAQADAGVLVGTAINSTIKNVKVSGKLTSSGTETDNKRYSVGGLAGFVYSTGNASLISGCRIDLTVVADKGSNTKNGATGTMYGGVAGFITCPQDASLTLVEDCVNNGTITSTTGRSSGICATANYGAHFKNCVNNANQVNTAADGRIGNLVSMMYKSVTLEDCVNNGDLTSATHAGAMVGLINDVSSSIKGGSNKGTIIGGNDTYRGLIGANLGNFTSIDGVVVGGKLGKYVAGGDPEMIDVNASNFEQYIGYVSDANRTKITNLTWDGSAAPDPPVVVEGIGTAADLLEFASLVKTGGDISKFVVDGAVVLGADVDLGGAEWTPIGEGSATTAGVVTTGDVPFTGIFDGKGHTVDNFKINVASDAAAGYAAGLFGILNGATVKNVVIGSNVVIDGKSAGFSFLGGVAGMAINSTIENCTNKGKISLTGVTDAKRGCVGGIVGEMYTLEGETNTSYVKNCTNEGVLTSENSVNTNNGANGLSVGGIAGFSDGKNYNFIQNCTNKVSITAQATRLAGIVASANTMTKIEDCVNEGKISDSDVKASNSRPAGICSAGSTNVFITRCVNRGDVTFSVAGDTTHGYAGGILGQGNNDAMEIDACENYGAITSDMFKTSTVYMGIIIGNANSKAVKIKNCKVGGKIGPVTEDETFKLVTITADNFAANITLATAKAGNVVLTDNVFAN